MRQERLLTLFRSLSDAYGRQGWWPAEGPLEVVVGAILTQRTSWTNAERAILGLRNEGLLSLREMHVASAETIARAIRPAGCYNVKAAKLKAFSHWMFAHHRGDLSLFLGLPQEDLRCDLLAIYGIGPETADAIILYAAGKPSFVVDAYTRRLFERLGLLSGDESYNAVRLAFMRALPRDVSLFSEFHALIVRHGKVHCRPTAKCEGCPLDALCPCPAEHGESPR